MMMHNNNDDEVLEGKDTVRARSTIVYRRRKAMGKERALIHLIV
jgi:hypothetical protein